MLAPVYQAMHTLVNLYGPSHQLSELPLPVFVQSSRPWNGHARGASAFRWRTPFLRWFVAFENPRYLPTWLAVIQGGGESATADRAPGVRNGRGSRYHARPTFRNQKAAGNVGESTPQRHQDKLLDT